MHPLYDVFCATTYRIQMEQSSIDLRIGDYCASLENLLKTSHAQQAGWITAYNPLGKICSTTENSSQHNALLQEIVTLDYPNYSCLAIPDDPSWQPEPGFLLLNIKIADLYVLAFKFRQAAYLWIEANAIPQLIFTE